MTTTDTPNDEARSKALVGNPSPATEAAACDTAKLRHLKICGKLKI